MCKGGVRRGLGLTHDSRHNMTRSHDTAHSVLGDATYRVLVGQGSAGQGRGRCQPPKPTHTDRGGPGRGAAIPCRWTAQSGCRPDTGSWQLATSDTSWQAQSPVSSPSVTRQPEGTHFHQLWGPATGPGAEVPVPCNTQEASSIQGLLVRRCPVLLCCVVNPRLHLPSAPGHCLR